MMHIKHDVKKVRINVLEPAYADVRRIHKLECECVFITNELQIKNMPDIYLAGRYMSGGIKQNFVIDFGKKSRIYLPDSKDQLFCLAQALCAIRMYNTKEGFLMSELGQILQTLGYAVAHCELLAEREGRERSYYIPKHPGYGLIPDDFFLNVDETGIPRRIREFSDFLIRKYEMK